MLIDATAVVMVSGVVKLNDAVNIENVDNPNVVFFSFSYWSLNAIDGH